MMKICKEHHKILLREVEDHPQLWYSIFFTRFLVRPIGILEAEKDE